MRCLKIEDNQVHFLAEDGEYKPIDQIGKADLLFLLDRAVNDEFKMDKYDEEAIGHAAHRIIYRDIHDRFTELLENKKRFRDESELLFKSALEKYQIATDETEGNSSGS